MGFNSIRKAFLAVFLGTAVASSSFGVAAASRFGAMAYSPSARKYGYADNQSRARAQIDALRQCSHSDCLITTWYKNACGALAVGYHGWGGAWGNTSARASDKAVAVCRRHARKCHVVAVNCSR